MFEDIIPEKNKDKNFLNECPVCGEGYDGYVCPYCFFENVEEVRPPTAIRWKFNVR
jgi:hypothetical protein